MIALFLFACNEFTVNKQEDPDPVAQPDDNWDPFGQTPDWNNCTRGYHGSYYNLSINHPDIEPEQELFPSEDPNGLDWFDDQYLAFQRFDSSLDYGQNWWPVDENFAEDPQYFAVKWTSWLRVYEDATLEFSYGASDDFWLIVDGEIRFLDVGLHEFTPSVMTLEFESGQYPIEIVYAHRSGSENGLRFRLIESDNAAICYPEFD